MNCTVGPLRPRLIPFVLICSALLGSWGAADGTAPKKAKLEVARLGQEFKLQIRRQATLRGQGLRIKFVAVKEDSRCPADVRCIWAGNAAVQLEISTGKASQSLTLNTNGAAPPADENQYPGYKFKLVDLSPYPRHQKPMAGEYTATLLVTKD